MNHAGIIGMGLVLLAGGCRWESLTGGSGDGPDGKGDLVVAPDLSEEDGLPIPEEDLTGIAEDMTDGSPDMAGTGKIDADMKPPVLVIPTWKVTSLPVGQGPTGIATGDLNGDGKLDLVVTNYKAGAWELHVGDGAGGFKLARTVQVSGQPIQVVVGDWNGDGKLDVALTNWAGGRLHVFIGNGDTTFQAPVDYPTAFNPRGLVVGDWNGDKKLDLVVANANGQAISIFSGKGDGTFQRGMMDYPAGSHPDNPVVGDWNGDGKLDVVVVDDSNFQLVVVPGKGDGTFGAPIPFKCGPAPEGLAGGDWNGDGKLDVATSNFDAKPGMPGTVYSVVNSGVPALVGPAEVRPAFMATGDWNGDKIPDLVAINGTMSNSASFYVGYGDGTFRPAGVVAGAGTDVAAVGDLNGDGRVDLVVTNYATDKVAVLLNTTL